MTSLLLGLVGGFLGSLVMAVLMMASSGGQPALPQMFAARARGKPPTDPSAKMGGMVAHLVYGSFMGLVFVFGSNAIVIGESLWITGILFALVLFLIAAMVVMPASGVTRDKMRQMPKGRVVGLFVVHLVYGLVLVAVIVYAPVLGLNL